jgi:transcriptional regulator with XRE-family HTH domain
MPSNALQLEEARTRKGWTQAQAAARLGVSQGDLSLLERGFRSASPRLVKTARKVLGADVSLPDQEQSLVPASDLAKRLAALGYEPFAYLAGRARQAPEEVLLASLSHPDLEARVVEALPWLAFTFLDLDWNWLVDRSKRRDLQNRLGYVTTLAREVAEGKGDTRAALRLREEEGRLERSILAREDTLCRDSMTTVERTWLHDNRPEEAKHWRVLTDLRPEHLPYAA